MSSNTLNNIFKELYANKIEELLNTYYNPTFALKGSILLEWYEEEFKRRHIYSRTTKDEEEGY